MPLRALTDRDGVEWQVWDVVPQTLVSTTLEGGWLSFMSAGEKRRFAPIPLYWVNMTDDELLMLLDRARPVVERLGHMMRGDPGADAAGDEAPGADDLR